MADFQQQCKSSYRRPDTDDFRQPGDWVVGEDGE